MWAVGIYGAMRNRYSRSRINSSTFRISNQAFEGVYLWRRKLEETAKDSFKNFRVEDVWRRGDVESEVFIDYRILFGIQLKEV